MRDFDSYFEVSPVGDLLVRAARLHPARDALVFPNRRCTYQDLLDGAIRFGQGLLALGIAPGDHVGLLTTNSVEFAEAFFGINLLGCVAVPLNARHKASELGFIVKNADLAAIFTTSDPREYTDFGAILHEALPSLHAATNPRRLELAEAPRLRTVVLLREGACAGFLKRAEFDALAADVDRIQVDLARNRVRLRDTSVILYTSGTTANPKGCMLSHEALSRGPVFRARNRLNSQDHNIHWGGGPLFHIGSLAPLIGVVGAVGTYVTDEYFDATRALQLFEREGVTVAWPWFPAIMQSLLDHPEFRPARVSTLRSIMLIGPAALIERVQQAIPDAELLQGCGMTETAGIFALSHESETPPQRCRSQGMAVPGIDIRIVDPDTGFDVPPGQVGEILVRGHCVMNGYYNDPEKTAEAIDADGWLHTGDLYYRAVDGSLCFNGRIKDMLKVGGENVAAIEIEAFLCQHKGVKIAEVVGMPDPRLDEVPVAFVELRPGADVGAQELIDFCKGKIASYKVPRAIHFMRETDWPMSATKVNKRALRARLTSCT